MTELALDIDVERVDFRLRVDRTLPLAGITAVFGPSGSGKTTLLRTIAGLEPAARGRVACDGEVWQDTARVVPPHRRNVGYVFQDGRLFTHLTVEDNLRFALRHRRAYAGTPTAGASLPPGAPDSRAGVIGLDAAVDALELASLMSRRPATLSGGEQQRVAIARALLSNPRLLLMDEPLSSVDVNRRRDIVGYIERLPAAFGLPVLYVTHDIDEVIRLADRMLLLSAGRAAAFGTVKELLDRIDLWPLTGRLEAGSILEAVVAEHTRGMTQLRVDGQPLRVPGIDAAPGTSVRLRIHARDVVIATARPERLSIRNVLAARVARIDLDESIYAEVALALGAQTLRARITREALEELELAPDGDVFALIKSVAFDTDGLA
jgi:molybdate transport system ATP-binding protein